MTARCATSTTPPQRTASATQPSSGTSSRRASTSRRRSSRRCSSRSRTPTRTSTGRSARSVSWSTPELISAAAAAESALWGEALRTDPEWEPVFSPLADDRYAPGLETVYEAYLVHYGRSRLFAPADDDAAILLGDYLYAHGLVR